MTNQNIRKQLMWPHKDCANKKKNHRYNKEKKIFTYFLCMHIRVRMEEYGDGQNQEFSLVGTKVNHLKGGNKLPLYFHKKRSLLNMV